MSPPPKKRCVGGGRNGELITTAYDERECIREEGRPTPIDDGGQQQRITENLFNGLEPGEFSEPRIIERLVLHPLCSIRQRQPGSEILDILDRINLEFAEEVSHIAALDRRVRRGLVQLALDISDLAVSALESEGDESAGGLGMTDEFLDAAGRLVSDLRAGTGDERLRSELDHALNVAKELRGVRPAGLISALSGGKSDTA